MKNFLLTLLLLLMVLPFTIAQSFTQVGGSVGMDCRYARGVSFVDFNGDGWDDITTASIDNHDVFFYQNIDSSFSEISLNISLGGWSHQPLWVDYDNDDDKDLYVTVRGGANRLYQNDGSMSFTDVTAAAQLPMDSDWTYGACWGDYNVDGFIDLYVCNFLGGPDTVTNYLYQNNGDGTFTNKTDAAGVREVLMPAFCATFLDYNNDMLPDLYVAVDREFPNLLYENNGDGTFTEVGAASGAGVVMNAMNVGIGDYDTDGDMDIYVTNTPEGNALLRNNGDETFTEVAAAAGVGFYRIGWGGLFFDMENDLDLDLYVSSAHEDANLPNAMYVNDTGTSFIEPLPNGLPGDTLRSHSSALGDYNNDGLMDILSENAWPDSSFLFKNTNYGSNNWLKVALQGTISNRDGISSWIEVWLGGTKYVRYTTCGIGYLGQNAGYEHFGLGTATTVDSVIVRWPGNGIVDKLTNVSANQKITISESSSPLAVELLDFIAVPDREVIRLHWITAMEHNNDYFAVERSLDGINFREVGQVTSNGNATITQSYTLEDDDVVSGALYYYRLHIFDKIGKEEYSKIVTAKISTTKTIDIIGVYPNPVASSNVRLQLYTTHDEPVDLKVYNQLGQLIHDASLSLPGGEYNHQLETADWNSGLYLIAVSNDREAKFTRLIIQSP